MGDLLGTSQTLKLNHQNPTLPVWFDTSTGTYRYIHVYIYIYICVCRFMAVMCIYIYVCTHTHIHTDMRWSMKAESMGL